MELEMDLVDYHSDDLVGRSWLCKFAALSAPVQAIRDQEPGDDKVSDK